MFLQPIWFPVLLVPRPTLLGLGLGCLARRTRNEIILTTANVAFIMKIKYFCEFETLVMFRKKNFDEKNLTSTRIRMLRPRLLQEGWITTLWVSSPLQYKFCFVLYLNTYHTPCCSNLSQSETKFSFKQVGIFYYFFSTLILKANYRRQKSNVSAFQYMHVCRTISVDRGGAHDVGF